MNRPPLASGLLPQAMRRPAGGRLLRIATYNIHKGVRGLGPARRLEIHNLRAAVAALDADLIALQEVRRDNHREARRFDHSRFGWPAQAQADFLAPPGHAAAYRSNARTRHGEHGNALLSRWPLGEPLHRDLSDHRFEQRGLLQLPVQGPDGVALTVVVVHFGLHHAGRRRQAERLIAHLAETAPRGPLIVAGDFNDWGERLDPLFAAAGLARACAPDAARRPTFPSIAPVFALDRFYVRGLRCRALHVPRGLAWARMSDHLPLVADFEAPAAGG